MTCTEARDKLRGPLKFGDLEQIKALQFLRDVDEAVELIRNDSFSWSYVHIFLPPEFWGDVQKEALRICFPSIAGAYKDL